MNKIEKLIEDTENKIDDTVIEFFEELCPSKKDEAHTWLIPLMVGLKFIVEDSIKKANNLT